MAALVKRVHVRVVDLAVLVKCQQVLLHLDLVVWAGPVGLKPRMGLLQGCFVGLLEGCCKAATGCSQATPRALWAAASSSQLLQDRYRRLQGNPQLLQSCSGLIWVAPELAVLGNALGCSELFSESCLTLTCRKPLGFVVPSDLPAWQYPVPDCKSVFGHRGCRVQYY